MGAYEIAGEIAKRLKAAGWRKVGIVSAEGFATIVHEIRDEGVVHHGAGTREVARVGRRVASVQ
jgi:hypothetical protein